MNELKFRNLKAEEIELRVGNTKRKDNKQPKSQTNPVIGFQLLLYKNARVDANILDETVGVFNWQKKFYQVKNTMICSLGININYADTNLPKEFIWKDDAGDESDTEAVKGEASDSFKRAAFAFGLGRVNLYNAPFIWIDCAKSGIDEYAKLYVSEISYDKEPNGVITKLTIKERNTDKVVFMYKNSKNVAQNGEKPQLQEPQQINEERGSIDDRDLKTIQAYVLAMTREESRQRFYDYLDKNFGTMNPEMLTLSQGKQVLQVFQGRKK